MKTAQEMHFKERNPQETVEYLQSILKKMDIAVEEQILPKSSIGTYSMRVAFHDTDLGSNGKGVSLEYMKASAYAEFLERIQNGHLNPWGWYEVQPGGYCHCPDERQMTAEEIASLAGEQSFLKYYFTYKGLMDVSEEERAREFEKLHRVEFQFGRGKNVYEVRPFYSVRNDRVEYIPYYLYMLHYASNGMCAGNTPYEALVQGFSEIMERHVQKKILKEKTCLPDVPESYLQQFPEIWEKLKTLREIPGIRAYMKDGSFGGKYPVAVLLLVSENTGGFGVKLGCHPDFGIAMERTLTEATQGGDVKEYCGRSWIDFYNRKVDDQANIYNSYKFGQAQYPYELFGDIPDYEFVPAKDVSQKGNQELFEELAEGFLTAGYDILIRDVSYLGFPSYQMLIPGFSELQQETDLMAKVYNTRAYLAPYLAYPEKMTEKTARLLMGVLAYWEDSPMENQMTQIYSVYPPGSFPAEDMRKGWQYLSAMCSVQCGEYGAAAEKMLKVLSFARLIGNAKEDFYRCLYEYLTLRDVGKDHEQAIRYLRVFFHEALCRQVDTYMEDPQKVIEKQYASYDYKGWNQEEKKGECAVWEKIRRRLFQEYEKHTPDQLALSELFRTLQKSFAGKENHELLSGKSL